MPTADCADLGGGEYAQFGGGNFIPEDSPAYSDAACTTLTVASTSSLAYAPGGLDDALAICRANGFTRARNTELDFYLCSGN